MRRVTWLIVVALALVTSTTARADGTLQAQVAIKNTNGQVVGTLTLTQQSDGVLVEGSFQNLPAGAHGIHFHAVGTCAPNFDAAGGHFNPAQRQHGFNNPQGVHAGDLPNVEIGPNGTGTYRTVTTLVTLAQGAANSVYDADGTAVIVHANADDYVTDPSGNSGGRIACGVVSAAQAAQLPDTGTETMLVWPLLMATAGMLVGGAMMRRRVRA